MMLSFHLLNVTPKQDVVICPFSPQRHAKVSNLQINFPRLVHSLPVKWKLSQGELSITDKPNGAHSIDSAIAARLILYLGTSSVSETLLIEGIWRHNTNCLRHTWWNYLRPEWRKWDMPYKTVWDMTDEPVWGTPDDTLWDTHLRKVFQTRLTKLFKTWLTKLFETSTTKLFETCLMKLFEVRLWHSSRHTPEETVSDISYTTIWDTPDEIVWSTPE
jgi:hypothetical protein